MNCSFLINNAAGCLESKPMQDWIASCVKGMECDNACARNCNSCADFRDSFLKRNRVDVMIGLASAFKCMSIDIRIISCNSFASHSAMELR